MARIAQIEIEPKFLTSNILKEILDNLPTDAIITEISPANHIYKKSAIRIESSKFYDIPQGSMISKITIGITLNLNNHYCLNFFDMSNVLEITTISNAPANGYWTISNNLLPIKATLIPKLGSESLPPIHICSFTEFYRGFTDNYHYCICGKKQK